MTGATLILVLLLFEGCREEALSLQVKSNIDLPALLLSELVQNPDRPPLERCPIEIANPTSVDREVTLLRSGCSCYGLALDGKRLSNGETFVVAAKESRTVQLEFQPAESHSDKFYTADFSTTNPAGEPELISVKCRQRVFSDVRITPTTITVEAVPDEQTQADQQITIEHTYRGLESEQDVPEFLQLPPGITISNAQRSGTPEKLEKSLWKQMWTATVHVSLPPHRSGKPLPLRYLVSFPGERGNAVSARGSLVVHLRQTVVFPNRVSFGKVDIGKTRRRRILLTNTDDNAFRLRCDRDLLPPGLTVDLNEHLDQRHFVTLSVTPGHVGPFSEIVKLQTDMYDVTEIAIRVEGVAQ